MSLVSSPGFPKVTINLLAPFLDRRQHRSKKGPRAGERRALEANCGVFSFGYWFTP